MTKESPPLFLFDMEGKTNPSYDIEVLYDCLTKFDNGYYDTWFEHNNAFHVAERIRDRLLYELQLKYDQHPTSQPMSITLMSAYKSYLRFYQS